jgi:hypothetical protein
MLVEERHYRAIGHERGDTVGLVRCELQCPDPEENDRDGDPHCVASEAIGLGAGDEAERPTNEAIHW